MAHCYVFGEGGTGMRILLAIYVMLSSLAYRKNSPGEIWKSFRAVQEGEVYYLSSEDGFGMSCNLGWYDSFDYLTDVVFADEAEAV